MDGVEVTVYLNFLTIFFSNYTWHQIWSSQWYLIKVCRAENWAGVLSVHAHSWTTAPWKRLRPTASPASGSCPGCNAVPRISTSMGLTVMVRAESSQSMSLSLAPSWPVAPCWRAVRSRNTPSVITSTSTLTQMMITIVATLGTTGTKGSKGNAVTLVDQVT